VNAPHVIQAFELTTRKRSGDPTGITTEGESFATPAPRLHYVVESAPEPGTTLQVASGVIWLRMPMPIDLNHINLWLVEDGDGWTLIDTGYPAALCAEVWTRLMATPLLQERPLRRILLTHFHPDHLGLAGWLQSQHAELPLWMAARGEAAAHAMIAPVSEQRRAISAAYLESHGIAHAQRFLAEMPSMAARGELLAAPKIARHLRDGETFRIGGGEWQVIETDGHADAHQSFHCATAGVLVSGDQVLPSISPNVSLSAQQWGQDPLGDYLASLDRMDALPAGTLVLPSHGRPFRGLHARTADLRAHHAEQLQRLEQQIVEPHHAAECMPTLFGRRLLGFHRLLGLHECVAHLEHLVHRGRAVRETSVAGLHRYRHA
jgi:glyoxylase-like metal-dependent hydrolase (beta-lactamase superfamily II)